MKSIDQSRSSLWIRPVQLITAILLVSLLLRWVLIFRGGQYYFSDEQRYEVSRDVVDLVLQGKPVESIARLFTPPEHLGFKILGIVPALIERLIGSSLFIPALFFSLFSVLNLYLIFLLSQRAGATTDEALLALGLAAASQSLLYYSRHLMPYDSAMTFGLLSLYVGLKKEAAAKDSFLCGALGFLCFITYNGYWILAGFAMLCHLVTARKDLVHYVRRGGLIATGFVLPLLFTVLVARLGGINLLQEYAQFAGTVTQGEYSEGWRLPIEYFWHAEHFLIIILVTLALYGIFNEWKTRGQNLVWWIAGTLFVYAGLVVFSVYFQSFVVLGRLSRQIMPFLILLAAHGLGQIHVRKVNLSALIIVVIFMQSLWNYGNSFALWYPREFTAEAQLGYPDFSFSEKRLAFGAPALCKNNSYIMENAKYLLIAPEMHSEIPGVLLLSESHPVNFLPYQYEGYTPEQREKFRQRNTRMNFYKMDDLSENDNTLKNLKNCFIRE